MAADRLRRGFDGGQHFGPQRLAGFVDVEEVDHAGLEVEIGDDQPDGVGVRADQVLVAEFESRRRDGAGDHVLAAAEVVGVVGVSGRAVGEDDGRLSRIGRPARTVGRSSPGSAGRCASRRR